MPKFKMPEGVEVPEGLMAGDSFQVVATVVMGDGGKAELVEVDGMPIAGYEKKAKGKKGVEMEEEEYEGDGEESAVVAERGPRGGGFIEEVMARKRG